MRCSTASPTASRATSRRRSGPAPTSIQLFDSWVGALSVADYEEFAAPYSARILAAPTVPTIHFGTGASNALLRALTRAGGDVIGLDWRLPLDEGWETRRPRSWRPGEPRSRCAARALGARRAGGRATCCRRAGGRPGHIFNLGHGVLPRTDPDAVTRLAALVREGVESGTASATVTA